MSREPFKRRDAYRVWWTIGTRWLDNDIYGHVNNAVYYQWFDSAVNRWLIETGLLVPAKSDLICLVVESGCRYQAPLGFPDAVGVGLSVDTVGRSSIAYRIGIFGPEAAEASAEGHFVHVCVDRETRRPVVVPEAWRRHLEAIATSVSDR